MQKHRYIFGLIALDALILLVLSNFVMGQSVKELTDLYENQQFLKLKEYHKNNQIQYKDWKQFIGALFEDNADSALVMFANVYRYTQDKVLKRYLVERISGYYYAKGYYKTAERLSKDRKFLDEITSAKHRAEKSNSISYGIQLGAFSDYENALALKNNMLKKERNVTIVNKESNGENLYVVVLGRYSDREVAERELQLLRSRNVDGFIIQY